MKHVLIAIFLAFIAISARADFAVYDNHRVAFTSSAVEQAINELVAESIRQDVADKYQEQMDPETGKISVVGLYRVCVVAYGTLESSNRVNACRNLVNRMMDLSGFGGASVNKTKCVTKFNGIWALNKDGSQYECVGRDGSELKYHKSCNGEAGECVTAFKNLQTHDINARKFINQWGLMHGNKRITCYVGHETRRGITSLAGQDYIRCSAEGKSYEFEFDDLVETDVDTITMAESVEICKLFGGTVITDLGPDAVFDYDDFTHCEILMDICKTDLATFANQLYHDTVYQGGYCQIKNEASKVSFLGLSSINGVNNYAFRNVQIRMDLAKPLAEQYLRTVFPGLSHNSIWCDTEIKKLSEGGLGLGVDIDFVLTCNAAGKTIDFVFDDLTETVDYEVSAGRSGMECVINGGKYRGKKCSMLTRKQCEEVSNKITGGTTWNEKDGYCELNNVSMTYTINSTISTVGSAVLVGVLTYVSGGSVSAILVAVDLDVAFNVGFEVAQDWVENNPNHQAAKFLKQAVPCENAQCARSIVSEYFSTLQATYDGLDDPDTIAAVISHIDRLSGLLSDDEFISAIQSSSINLETKTATMILPMLMALGTVADPQSVLSKLSMRAPRLAAKLGHWRMQTFFNKYSTIMEAVESSTLNGSTYVRMYVGNKSQNEIQTIVRTLQENGMYVSSGTATQGQKFIGFSDQNMFGAWDNARGNWLRNSGRVSQFSDMLARDFVQHKGAFVSRQVYAGNQADSIITNLTNNGYIAIKQETLGRRQSEQYLIIAVHSSNIGNLQYTGRNLVRINTDNMQRARQAAALLDKPSKLVIIKNADMSAYIHGVVQISGRPVALVTVTGKTGQTITLPFYVSTGTTGKTSVPTGKWEFFGGFVGTWFQKGNLQSIINHYNSPQLQQIANALDRQLGDLRDTEYVLETIGREYAGGIGAVASADNSPLANWDAYMQSVTDAMGGTQGKTVFETVNNIKYKMGW